MSERVSHRMALAGVALILAAQACTSPSLARCDAVIDQYLMRDGRVILRETARLLPSLSLRQQFQIYHCSARALRPSLTDLAPVIAAQPDAGPFLVAAVRDAPDDATILSAVELLAEMKLLNTYHAENDPQVMAILNSRVLAMQSEALRTLAQSKMRPLLGEVPVDDSWRTPS